MAHFPVIHSIVSAHHLAKFLCDSYPLDQNTKCTLIRAGINHTYLVSDSTSKFVFRVYSLGWRSRVEISEEIRLLNLLSQNKLPVSFAVADKKGNYIQTLLAPEGERFGVLFRYAAGKKVHDLPAQTHYDIGVLMAEIHQVSENITLNRTLYSSDVLLVDSLRFLKEYLPEETAEMQFMHRAQRYLLHRMSAVNRLEVREGAVHMDFWFDNLNITTEGSVTIFDFDFCGYGWLCLDIAYYVMQLYNIERYDIKGYGPKVSAFLSGYESVTRMSEEEKNLIPSLGVSLYFFYLGIQCQRYENWSNSFLNENYLKRYINGIVKRYCDLSVGEAFQQE